MRRLFICSLIMSAFYFPSYSQGSLIEYEQTAFNFFCDSLIKSELKNIESAYLISTINSRVSSLGLSTGFSDYGKLLDSMGIEKYKKDVKKAEQKELSNIELQSDCKNIKVVDRKYNFKKIPLPKPLILYVLRKNLIKDGYYFVEIYAYRNGIGHSYIIEINKEDKKVTRWYKTTWGI